MLHDLSSFRDSLLAAVQRDGRVPEAIRTLTTRGEEVLGELNRLDRFERRTAAQDARYGELMDEARDITRTLGLSKLTGRADGSRVIPAGSMGADGSLRTFAGSPGEEREQERERVRDPFNPMANLRDDALRILDAGTRDGSLPGHAAERVEKMMQTGTRQATSYAARWAALTGSQAYRSAFAKLVTDPERGHLLWTAQEAEAFRDVRTFQLEERAMGLTDTAGGYLVPMHLDPAILLTSNGSADPLRRLARVEQISTDVWNGVTSAGATAEWKAEAAEAADGSPTLAQPPISVHFGDSFVPFSFEVGMDAGNLVEQLSIVLADAADQLMSAAYWRGTGTGQPKGLVTALVAAGTSSVATTTADTLAIGDPVNLQNALPPRFQPNAAFTANLATINAIGSFETLNGALRYPEVGNGRLLNRGLHEASQLDNAGATATAGNDEVMVYGDFRNFVIVDRIGTQLELIPHLFGTNGRPKGQRGAFLWFRTGSDVVVANAFRMLTA